MDNDIFKQGVDYKEEVTNAGKVEEEVLKAEPKKVDFKKLIMIGAGILTVSVVVIIGIAVKSSTDKSAENDITNNIIIDVPKYSYSKDERTMLRSFGYSGDEIEYLESREVLFEKVINDAEEKMKKRLTSMYVQLSKEVQDTASPEYAKLLSNTWLGGKPFEVNAGDITKISRSVIKENVDYEKVSSNGEQLFVKLTLENGVDVFMAVKSERWVELRNKGNMIIEYNKETMGKKEVITSIRELQP